MLEKVESIIEELHKQEETDEPAKEVEAGDSVVVHMGSIIPFDGEVRDGEAMINQASMTGESMPVRKEKGSYVYAGTVVEEGEIVLDILGFASADEFYADVGF